MSKQGNGPEIRFKAKLVTIGSWTVLQLPEKASAQLPSRGQTMIEGTMNGADFRTPLEPDGKGSHWFRPAASLLKDARAKVGDTVQLVIFSTKDWPEPDIPANLRKAIAADTQAHALWQRITPMARWEWIRWSRATANSETRTHRMQVAVSKLKAGERRPCCWNRNLCTEPRISKNGVLFEPTKD